MERKRIACDECSTTQYNPEGDACELTDQEIANSNARENNPNVRGV